MTAPTTRKDLMIVNMGPQHPSMHGVLRLIITLDGEDVIDCEPILGYLHRGMEKIAENRTIIQYLPYVTRWDYLATMFTEAITINWTTVKNSSQGLVPIISVKEFNVATTTTKNQD